MPYTVQPGDSASAIAARYGLSLSQFQTYNPNGPQSGNWDLINPGEVFNIDAAYSGTPYTGQPPPPITPGSLPGITPPSFPGSAGLAARPQIQITGQTSVPWNGNQITPPSFTGGAGLADPNYAGPPANTGANPNQTPYSGPMAMPGPASGVMGNTADDVLNAQREVIMRQRAQFQAQMGLTGPRGALTAADRHLLDARENNLVASQSYLNEQQRANEQRLQEEGNIQGAKNNVGDILSVSRAQRTRDSLNYRYNIAGLPTPIEVKLPPDYKGRMPPGIVARLQTLAEILTDQSADNEKMRQFRLEAARIHTANTGQAVEAAQIARGHVALTLDEAEEAARIAGLLVDEAQLNLASAQLPPQGGLIYDEVTGSWVSPTQASINQSLHRQQLMNQQLGPLGSVPADTLMSMATQNPPVISDAELRQALIVQGMAPEAADRYVALAAARRATGNGSDDASLQAIADLVAQALGNNGATGTPANTLVNPGESQPYFTNAFNLPSNYTFG